MTTSQNTLDLQSTYRTTSLFCGALFISSMMIGLIMEIAKPYIPTIQNLSQEFLNLLRIMLYIVVLLELAFIPILRTLIFPKNKPLAPSQKLSKLKSISVLTFIIGEGIILYGIVLIFLEKNYSDFYVFLAISLMVQLFYFPRYHRWEILLQDQE